MPSTNHLGYDGRFSVLLLNRQSWWFIKSFASLYGFTVAISATGVSRICPLTAYNQPLEILEIRLGHEVYPQRQVGRELSKNRLPHPEVSEVRFASVPGWDRGTGTGVVR
jgi:hypothetical protein